MWYSSNIHTRQTRFFVALAFLFPLAPIPLVEAAQFVVNPEAIYDYDCGDTVCSLPYALQAAQDNGEDDVINFAPGRYELTTTVGYAAAANENHSLTLSGPVQGEAILDGTAVTDGAMLSLSTSAVNTPNDHTDITIERITFTLAHNGATVITAPGTSVHVTLLNNKFTGSIGLDDGVVKIDAANSDSIRVTGNTFLDNNVPSGEFTGVLNFSSSGDAVHLEHNIVRSNTALAGGNIIYFNHMPQRLLEITGNTLEGNSAYHTISCEGGASDGVVSINNNSAHNNNGHVFYVATSSSVVINNNHFTGNEGPSLDLLAFDSTATVTNNMFQDNLLGSVFISAGTSPGTISDNRFFNNTSEANGGALRVYSVGLVTLSNNVFQGNHSGSTGGAVYADTRFGTAIAFINNTFVDNHADSGTGGALYYASSFESPNPKLSNYLRLFNNIFWQNSAILGTDLYLHNNQNDDDSVANVTLYHNLYPKNGLIIRDILQLLQANNLNADPLLMADLHLQPGSPAIDTGYNNVSGLPAFDWDGQARILDGNGDGNAVVDIGADEYSFADMLLQPLSLSYGDFGIGSTTAMHVLSITNRGNQPLLISQTSLTGDHAADFTLLPEAGATPCGALPVTLAVGKQCNIAITFTPGDMGVRSAVVTIYSNDFNKPILAVPVSGNGIANEAPSAPVLLSPANGTEQQDINLTLQWRAAQDPDDQDLRYHVLVCTDAELTSQCQRIEYPGENAASTLLAGAGASLLGLALLLTSPARRRVALMWVLPLVIAGATLVACGSGGTSGDSGKRLEYALSNLDPGTTYYWRISADDGVGGLGMSEVWHFSTR